ncbi:MAG: hypothetical protein JSR82_05795 [Verrucomicrobia bacterium]|nr:hypothetical protein [Verrucomicrobiota bacterium]
MVSKEEISRNDVSGVCRILNGFVPHLLERNRNRVFIRIDGFRDDVDRHELFEFVEVRAWYHLLFETVPGFFYWMDLRRPWFNFYARMFVAPIHATEATTVSGADLQRFLLWGYKNLNEFCDAHGVRPDLADLANKSVRRSIEMELGRFRKDASSA